MNSYWIFPALLSVLTLPALAETRYHQYTRQFSNPSSPAIPVAAGYLGGSGDETLTGAAVLPDGTILLGGNVFGPDFQLPGVRIGVAGRDATAPSFRMPVHSRGKQQGKPNVPDWTYRDGAGFIVRLNSDLAGIAQAVRFPWGSGSLTDLTADAAGNVYATGHCGPNFGNLTPSNELQAPGLDGDSPVFIGRLRPDLSGFVWCHVLRDHLDWAPTLTALPDGRINLTSKNAYQFDASGRLLKATQVQNSSSWARGVDPVTHSMAKGGDGNTRTGWEPWRQPRFQVFNDQDLQVDDFYSWDAKLVGTNWSRLVSDSDIRGVNYDREGHLLVIGWSDGGNSVLEYLPYDLRTSVYSFSKQRTGRKTGLGFSTWGAGVGSFSHLIKIDPATGEVLAKTLFCAYLADENKPNSAKADIFNTAVDNSVLIAGGSASGMIETSSLKLNTLSLENGDYMGGPFVAVLNGDMSDLRFSSVVPGFGKAPIRSHSSELRAEVATASGRVGGKVVSVFVGGGVKDDAFTPKRPAQSGFGGGHLDGMYVIVSMDPDQPRPDVEVAEDSNKGRGGKEKDDQGLTGTFQISEGMDRDYSVLALRDPAGVFWPAYYLCHPKGSSSVDASGSGQFTLFGGARDVQLSEGKRQNRRIGGVLSRVETFQDDKGRDREARMFPELQLDVRLDGPDRCQGIITYNGRRLPVLNGSLDIRKSKPTGKGINLSGRFDTTLGALGLAEDDPRLFAYPVQVEFWAPGRP